MKIINLLFFCIAMLMISVSYADRDPTTPPWISDIASHAEAGRVYAIIYSATQKMALLDDTWVHENQMLGSSKIIAITNNAVKIESPLGVQTLTLLTPVQQETNKNYKD